jgi:hypothetical protein
LNPPLPGCRRSQSAQIEEEARRRIETVERDFVFAASFYGYTGNVAKRPESNGFDMRISGADGRTRLRKETCSRNSGSGKNPAGEAEHSGI